MLTRKRLFIVGGVILAVVLTGLLGGFAIIEQLFVSDDSTATVEEGEILYGDIMGRHPLLMDRSSFEPGADDAGSEINQMRIPRAEWAELDQPQKNSLAKYLESMGAPWRIEVGHLSKDGQRFVSLRPEMTSEQWHDVVK